MFCARVLFTLTAFLSVTEGCTLIVVGKNATTDGSTIVAHTDDAGGGAADIRLIRVEAQDHEAGSKRPVYNFNGGYPRLVSHSRGSQYLPKPSQNVTEPLGYIPQVNHTFAYFDQDYGMMNEVQLAMGESTCAARTVGWPLGHPGGHNLFGIAELSKVALERCDSARCAIRTMGALAVKYGFFSEDSGSTDNPLYADSAETLGIADKYGETWVFHVLTGVNNKSAIWAAQRIPETHVLAVANSFVIRQMNLSDTENFMASPNITQIAEAMGWWEPSTPFDFTTAFGYSPPGPLYPLYSGRRVWRIYDLVAPSLALDSTLGLLPRTPTYPFSVFPDNKLHPQQIMNILMDYYQGTEYDMTKGIAAGPFGSPVRYDGPSRNVTGGWERPISMFRTMFSFVLQSYSFKPNHFGTMWYGQGTPALTVYVPFSCAQNTVPTSYIRGKESVFDMESAWWAFKFVNNWCLLRYNVISQDVKVEQERLQALAFKVHNQTVGLISSTDIGDKDELHLTIEKSFNNFADKVVDEWWTLAWTLVSKYSDGFITTGESPELQQSPGYPKWWLETTSFSRWPGHTFSPPSLEHPESSTKWHCFIYGIVIGALVIVMGALFFYRKKVMRTGYQKI